MVKNIFLSSQRHCKLIELVQSLFIVCVSARGRVCVFVNAYACVGACEYVLEMCARVWGEESENMCEFLSKL